MRPAQSDSAHRCPQSHKRHSKPGRPGPARRPPRSRSKPGRRADERGEPLSCSPPQSRRHARTPASDARERNRPLIWSCGCWQLRQRPWPLFCQCACCPTPPHAHGAGSGGGQPPRPCSAQTPGRPAIVTARAGTPAPNRGSQLFLPGSRYRNAAGSALSAFPRLTGAIRPTVPKRLPQPATGGKASKAAAGQAAAVHCRGCVPVFVRRRPRASQARLRTPARGPACRQAPARVRSAAPLASPPQVCPTPLRTVPPAAAGLPRRFWIQSGNAQKTRNAPQLAAKRPGATDPAPTAPAAERFHLLHPRQHTTTRCRHTTAPARPRTNAGRDAWAKPRSTQQDFVKGDLADVGH